MRQDVRQLLDELAEVNNLLATPGGAVGEDRDLAVARRRELEDRYRQLEPDPGYVEEARDYAARMRQGAS